VNADQATALALYAMLTGRVSQVVTGKVVDINTLQYSDDVPRENWTSAWFNGVFAQDGWRMKPNFTLNYGMRWEVAQAPYNHLGIACSPTSRTCSARRAVLFQPGVLNGEANPVMRRGKYGAKTDWVNPAPRVGFAWTPDFAEGGWMGRIFGTGSNTVIRGSYDITYYDEGTNMFSSTRATTPGSRSSCCSRPATASLPAS
jgi:outer membrane receptor protein involved in Fe transport